MKSLDKKGFTVRRRIKGTDLTPAELLGLNF